MNINYPPDIRGFALVLVVIFVFVFVFAGEPDIHDAILQWMVKP